MITKEKSRKFLVNILKQSEEVQFYFGHEISNNNIKKISELYNINFDFVSECVTEVVAENFDFDKMELTLPRGLFINNEDLEKFKKDFIGIIFCPLVPYMLDIDIVGSLVKRGGSIQEYNEYIDEFKIEVEAEVIRILAEAAEKRQKEVNKTEEVEAAINIFSDGLRDLLSAKTDESILNLNNGLFFLLMNVNDFREKLSAVLLANSELLTNNNIEIDGKQASPTVANWLRDFIKQRGSGMFDNIVLSDFVSNSRNAMRLSADKRELLRKLLLLYRNLKFFPESMGDLPPEYWEIVPIDHREAPIVKSKKTTQQPRMSNRIVIEEPVRMQKPSTAVAGAVNTRIASGKSIQSSKIEELKKLAEAYPVGSLEKRLIEEEIKKIK